MEFEPSDTMIGLRGTAQRKKENSRKRRVAAVAARKDLRFGKGICLGNLSPSQDRMPCPSLGLNGSRIEMSCWTTIYDLRLARQISTTTGLADKTEIKSKPSIGNYLKIVDGYEPIYTNFITNSSELSPLLLRKSKEERELGN